MKSKTPAPQRSGRRGRPVGIPSDETRARILASARDCYASVGYSRATNARIGQLAGVTPANLYYYFASKADLFVAVGETVSRSVESSHAEAVRGASSLRGKLCSVIESFAGTLERDPRLGQFFVVWSLELDRQPELQSRRMQFRRDSLRFYERLLDDAKVRGELPDDADPEGLAEGVQSILLGLSVLASGSKGHVSTRVSETDPDSPLRLAGRTLSAWLAGTYFGSPRQSIPKP